MLDAKRRRQRALLLQQYAMQPQLQNSGQFAVGPTALSSIAGLASAFGGAYQNRKADKEEKQARTDEQARLAQAMKRILAGGTDPGVDPVTGQGPAMNAAPNPQQQAAIDLVQGLPLDQQQNVVAGKALETLFPKPVKKEDPYAKIDPKDYTPDSVKRFEATNDRSVLVPRTKLEVSGGEAYDPYSLKPGQKVGTPGQGTTVNVNTEKNLYGTMADAQGKENVALYGQAQKAPDLLQRAQRVKLALGPDSHAITGAGADQLLALSKVAAQLGFNTGDAAADTESLSRELASSTLDQIKSSGLGGGSGFSNADRDFLEKAVGGKITLEAATLRRLAELNEKSALGTIQRWNATASRLKPEELQALGMAPIQMPAGTAAPTATPKLQRNADGSYTYSP